MFLQTIQKKIYEIRGQKVMLDFDLAALYEVQTKVLKQSVKRNLDRFPSDFMFELTIAEFNNLRSQFVTSSYGGIRYMPFAFTEQGVAMLSSVLKSPKAIQVNILIVRTFVLIRQYALSHKDLTEKLKEHENKFEDVYKAINFLLEKDQLLTEQLERKPIGFISKGEE
jgi:hypothetical protein